MGTTKAKTAELTADIKLKLGTESMAHLTCVGSTQDEIYAKLMDLKTRGIENVLGLRGDPPQGFQNFEKPEGGFGYANELIHFIREKFDDYFSIGAACYPEVHVECADEDLDLKHLKQKVEAGADFVITQLFFINDNFFRFIDRAHKAGIRVPIIPGIMPITNLNQLVIFAEKCGVQVPKEVHNTVHVLGEDKKGIEAFGVEYATKQCEKLLQRGAPGIHFYTLNRSKSTKQIFQNLNLQKRFQTKARI